MLPIIGRDDEYENFFLRNNFFDAAGQICTIDVLKETFGMSWPLQSETDPLWRIYSQDERSVKLKTPLRKLYN